MLSFATFTTLAESYVTSLDPHALKFTEKGQNTGEQYQGDPESPILAYKDSKGQHHVVDGHHRVLHARKHNKPVNAIVMPGKTFRQFKKQGIHPAQMKTAYARHLRNTGKL